MRLHGADVNLTVERGLEGRMDPAFRDPLEVGFAQRHVDNVVAVVAGRPDNLAGEPERGQHTARVVVGSPADEGDHPGHRVSTKGFGAQLNSCLLDGAYIVTGDEQLDLTTAGRHGREIELLIAGDDVGSVEQTGIDLCAKA